MKTIIIRCIQLYQHTITHLFPHSCAFFPTCSEYAKIAVEKHGVVRGGRLAVKRIMKCYPGRPYSIDLVPKK